jgi:regulatory protein
MDFLALREYGQKELINKLRSKGFSDEISSSVVERLTEDGLQNDSRFIESFIRSRIKQGKGQLKITQELEQKNLPSQSIFSALNNLDMNWIELAHEVRIKKFGNNLPDDFNKKAKQIRFLQSRGFENEIIRKILN